MMLRARRPAAASGLAAAVALAVPAAAGTTHDTTGRVAGTDRSHVFPIAANYAVVLMVAAIPP